MTDVATLTQEVAKQRVQKGAALIAKKRRLWFNEVVMTYVEMNDCFKCMLGQLFLNYSNGLSTIFGTYAVPFEEQVEHGFSLSEKSTGHEWDILHREWLREIQKQRELAASASARPK